MVDLFIKTHTADHEWLAYALRFVDRYATGFRRIVLVTSSGQAVPPTRLPQLVHVEPQIPAGTNYTRDHRFPNSGGIGYVWQMGIKWSWPDFTDADAVVMMDSDYYATGPFSPERFHLEGRPVWVRRRWADSAPGSAELVWRSSVAYCLGQSLEWDYLVDPSMFYTRRATLALHRFLRDRWHQSPYEYVLDGMHRQPTEHGVFGAFVGEIEDHGYKLVTPEEYEGPFRMHWSWGGLSPAIREMLEKALVKPIVASPAAAP